MDKGDKDQKVRWRVADSLAKLNSSESIEPFVNSLKKEKDVEVQVRIIEAMGELTKKISNKIHDIKNPDVISEINKEQPEDKLAEKLKELLTDEKEIAGIQIYDKVIKAIRRELDSQHIDVKLAAIDSLGKLRASKSLPGLLKSLQHTDPTIRLRTVEALKQIKDKKAIEPIREAMKKEGIFSIMMRSVMSGAIKDLERLPD